MKPFIIRIVCLAIVFGVLLFKAYPNQQSLTVTLLIISCTLCFYFLTPISKKPLIHYSFIALFIAIGSMATPYSYDWLPLFGFFIVEAAFQLKEKAFFLLIGFSAALIIGLALFLHSPLFIIFLLAAFLIGCGFLSHYLVQLRSLRMVHEQLLSQYRQLRRYSVEQEQFVRAEERTRIARDIHDSVGHKLTTLLMQLEMMMIQQNTESLVEAKELARDSLDETRYAVRQLKAGQNTGIQSVLHLIRKLEMESHLQIRFTFEKGVLSLPISNDQSVVLYRVLQESLTNAMKHGFSKEVEVIIGMNSVQNLQFQVTNKVQGDSPIMQGFGLTNMKERLQEIGGELRITRVNGNFTLIGFFPIAANATYFNGKLVKEGEWNDNTYIAR